MMHGYMPFNDKAEILVPFRTWRNTNTGKAAAELSELFVYNIPLRWSISHLYQAILNKEEHVKDITFLTTLAGYVHWQITGERYWVSVMRPVCFLSTLPQRTILPKWWLSSTNWWLPTDSAGN